MLTRKDRSREKCVTLMHFARRGIVTEEMARVAERESVPVEKILQELGSGKMIIPANVNHPSLDPMGVGKSLTTKINANIGNSTVTSEIDQEVEKLHLAVHQ